MTDTVLMLTYPHCEFSIYHGPYHDVGVSTILIWRMNTADQRTIKYFPSLDEGQRYARRLNDDRAKLHLPTGFPCRIMTKKDDRSFCDFYERTNPFTWVMNSELA